MSLDAEYIFDYYSNAYMEPTPMQIDKRFLEHKYGGKVEFINSSISYWSKPKYTLNQQDIDNLLADRVLEKHDCELLVIIK